MNYYNSRILNGLLFDDVKQKVTETLKAEGFGILNEIDLKATMKIKLDKDYLPHIILGACNPVYADKVLTIDPHISTMLPCNVTIRQIKENEIELSSINPDAAMNGINNPAIEILAKEIQDKLKRALENVK